MVQEREKVSYGQRLERRGRDEILRVMAPVPRPTVHVDHGMLSTPYVFVQ